MVVYAGRFLGGIASRMSRTHSSPRLQRISITCSSSFDKRGTAIGPPTTVATLLHVWPRPSIGRRPGTVHDFVVADYYVLRQRPHVPRLDWGLELVPVPTRQRASFLRMLPLSQLARPYFPTDPISLKRTPGRGSGAFISNLSA